AKLTDTVGCSAMPVAADPTIENVVLLACGSYNPVTNMHLRMFEVARDALRKSGRFRVLGGIISPVADAFGKEDLASAEHRLEMLRLALSPPAVAGPPAWIRLGKWEATRRRWTPTRQVLDRYQAAIDAELTGTEPCSTAGGSGGESCDETDAECIWLRKLVRRLKSTAGASAHGGDSADRQTAPLAARLMLLCGADLLASFARPSLWRTEDMVTIARDYGMVVLARSGFNPQKFIYECDAINPFEQNLVILSEWSCNDTSSSQIRRSLRRGESVRYLLPDSVIDYVYRHRLYGCRADCWHGQSSVSSDDAAEAAVSSSAAAAAVQRCSRGCQTRMTGSAMPAARIRKECRACGARSTRHVFLSSAAVDDQRGDAPDCLPQQQQHGDSRHDRHRQQSLQQDAASVAALPALSGPVRHRSHSESKS
ncbi:hypothetical protein BOX15_Mlig027319g1, partial [Macrostomum lignano]